MTRYSASSGLDYGHYGTGIYGTGDIPDLRLSKFEVRPTDALGSYVDAQGLPVFGRGTVFWDFRAAITPKVKLLRSTKGFATTHLDNFSTVIAATDYPINLAAATVDEYGWTVVATSEPHFLKSGDVVSFSGVPVPTKTSANVALSGLTPPWDGSRLIDGSWVVSTILGPNSFGVRQNHKPLPVGTTAMIVTAAGLKGLPFDVSGFSTYTADCGHIATPSLARLATSQKWAMDQSVVPGVEYYYSLWVADPTVAGLWVLGGDASFIAPKDHNSIDRFFSVLPPYLTNVNYGSLTQPLIDVLRDTDVLTPGDPTVGKFLAGMAWEWDGILTLADRVQRLWDAATMPAALLPSAIATFGLPNEPTFGLRAQRAMVQNAQFLSSARGTQNGLTAFVEALVGLSTTVTVGENLLLTTESSSFAYGTGTWAGTNCTVALTNNPVLPIPDYTYFVTDSSGTPGGSMAVTQTASTPSVQLAGGVANTTLTATDTYLRVATTHAHGLEVGDQVTISGAASGFNLSGLVTAVPTATQYTMAPTSGPTPGSTTVGGQTGYNPAALINPFAVTQGIPVTAGTNYQISFYGSGSGTAAATFYWWDAQGRPISNGAAATATALSTTGLVLVAGSVVAAPTNAAYLTVSITFAGGSTGSVFVVDGVMVTTGGTAPFEDARTVYIAMSVPSASIAADPLQNVRQVVKARLMDNLQNQLPVGTAFRLSINGVSL